MKGPSADDLGATTSVSGTAAPVDLEVDRRARRNWVVLLGPPVTWSAHFTLVYLLAEAGCTGDGPGLDLFDPPVAAVGTLALTAAGVLVCLWLIRCAYRLLGQADGRAEVGSDPAVGSTVAHAGLILGWIFLVSILLVGLPAAIFLRC